MVLIAFSCKNASVDNRAGTIEINPRGFMVYFADGYDNDTISLKVNGRHLFDKIILKSLSSLKTYPDSVLMEDRDTFVRCQGDTLFVKVLGKLQPSVTGVDFGNKLAIEVMCNGQWFSKKFLLSNGRYMYVFNGLNEINGSTFTDRIYFGQYKRLPSSE
jgi:hypothetical protein